MAFADDRAPQVVKAFTQNTRRDETFSGGSFNENLRNNRRVKYFSQNVREPGKHTLRIRMVDPTLVIEKIIISSAPLPPSFFRASSRCAS